MTNRKSHITSWILCAMFAALICVGAFIRIPLPYIPMTLQVLFVILGGLLLGPRQGAIAAGVYMVLGLVGVPVFTGGGGFAYVLKPTFGYIMGFVLGAGLTGFLAQRKRPGFVRCLLAGLAGVGVIYAMGLVYWYMLSNYILNVPLSVSAVILTGLLPVLPSDIISCLLCALLAVRLIPVTRRICSFDPND